MVGLAFDDGVLKQVASELSKVKTEYCGVLPGESIDKIVDESLVRLADSKVRQFVPLFVGRFTRQRLRELVEVSTAHSR